ncbi:MAG TPA: glycerol-3-phosphate 1-O-acyltransferase PlsY [Terriglobales bacterium]|nr:glycerol-3-phosphate 1-O-acyltransferase PlsY [Terriglobales bacterium]
MTAYLLIAVFSYLSGSIPFGYLLVQAFRGEDIRRSGSGNIGATNVARKSPVLGLLTLLLDGLKGFVPVMLAFLWAHRTAQAAGLWLAVPQPPDGPRMYTLASFAALFAILGHMFPVWLGFRGGKGVATGLGSWAAIAPTSILVTVLVFLLVVAVFRFVSLGSIVAAAALPLVAWILGDYHQAPLELFAMAASSLLIIAKHHENIGRLLAGTERRLSIRQGHS